MKTIRTMKGQRLLIIVSILGLLLTLAIGPSSLSVKAENPARPRANSSGDGYADLAIGVPYEEIGPTEIVDAGAVNVLFGSASTGLSSTGDEYWHQDRVGIRDTADAVDWFGYALAAGNFNGDGYIDLAVGVAHEDIGDAAGAGAVHILYGSSTGLSTTGDQLWHQDSPGIDGAADVGDRFGSVLAVGDFDGDGYDDLAVGVPLEDLEPLTDAGCVNVLYGSANGLTAAGDQLWHQDSADILEEAEAGDYFGYALATGDFDGDGYDDLAVGVPREDISDVYDYDDAGGVHILHGSATGLTATGNRWRDQSYPGVDDSVEAGDEFGHALAAGDFDGDGNDDLAVGVRYEYVGTIGEAGAVNILYGSSYGPGAEGGSQFWHQDLLSDCEAEPGDMFGQVLTTGDFDGDGYADLAVGVPYEEVWGNLWGGAVNVLYGSSPNGLTAAGNQYWHQDVPDVGSLVEVGDRFGSTLAAGDFNRDGRDDLAVGLPYEDWNEQDTGIVQVLYGSGSGLSATYIEDQLWRQDSYGILGTEKAGDKFGYALAVLAPVESSAYLPLVVRNYRP